MNHIELFAGCGGLSLGLESAGFELLIANELSPMAAETFAYNHLNLDLSSGDNLGKAYWISSQHPREAITKRLRENPFEAMGLTTNHHCDLSDELPIDALRRSLFVGSIVDLNKLIAPKDHWLRGLLKTGLGNGGVDLISGGPPCQSFSLAGMRDHSNSRNQLPWEFAKFVEAVQPKMALLENVTGILRPFKIEGKKYYAWFEVAKAFAKIGYVPICLHVNAKNVGAAQNRPRFILIALRRDFAEKYLAGSVSKGLSDALTEAKKFQQSVTSDRVISLDDLTVHDLERDAPLFKAAPFDKLATHQKDNLVSVKEAINDLMHDGLKESAYVERINSDLLNLHQRSPCKARNHELRRNNSKVRARFRLYQILSKLDRKQVREVTAYLRSGEGAIVPPETLQALAQHWMLHVDGRMVSKPALTDVCEILSELYTKKQTQRALIADDPAPAALSIPDDACHYNETVEMQRTLSVREMARIQSFPDWFEMRSKVTTGGQMRKFEVPQYTQVGNAVPPLLGLALGEVCRELLDQTYRAPSALA